MNDRDSAAIAARWEAAESALAVALMEVRALSVDGAYTDKERLQRIQDVAHDALVTSVVRMRTSDARPEGASP